uniref:Uncharacterized protein n=1 Tax=viral metagenome TaxID=1070528 RepID=A0A6C0DE68_9ZZZZ
MAAATPTFLPSLTYNEKSRINANKLSLNATKTLKKPNMVREALTTHVHGNNATSHTAASAATSAATATPSMFSFTATAGLPQQGGKRSKRKTHKRKTHHRGKSRRHRKH